MIERSFRTLREALEGEELSNLLEAERVLGRLVKWYNEERLHSALGYLPPVVVYRGNPEKRKAERRRKLAQCGTVGGKGTWACTKALSRSRRRRPLLTFDRGCAIAVETIHYVLALKDNQPTLSADVQELFVHGLETDFAGMKQEECQTQDQNHGRQETRRYHHLQPSKKWLQQHPEWKGFKTVGMVCSERQVGDGEPTGEVRFFISSLSLDVGTFARAVRSHWAIENNLHWVLDVSFREDDNRSRKDHTAENLAWIRRLTASLLAQDEKKVGVSCKRKMAGWDDQYLLDIAGRAMA